jgi:nicotinate-nucleotide adenylyltransferase
MRIGVYGGTFDPPHMGHLRLAQAAIRELDLDELILLPAGKNPLKARPAMASARQRLEMVSLLAQDHPKMAVSDQEIGRPGPSYTVDTLAELTMARPAEYWFLIGADNVKEIARWKQPDRLLKMCRLGVALRPPMGASELMARVPEAYRSRVDVVPMESTDVSSSEVRNRLFADKQPVAGTVPPSVLQYIREKGLYRA